MLSSWGAPLWLAKSNGTQRGMGKFTFAWNHLYVKFNVEDRYIKATATETHGPVWQDSCVELFISPRDVNQSKENVKYGHFPYFNIETNCCGCQLMYCIHDSRKKTDGSFEKVNIWLLDFLYFFLTSCEKYKIFVCYISTVRLISFEKLKKMTWI